MSRLKVYKTNHYGDKAYLEDNRGNIALKDIPRNEIWAIKNFSRGLIPQLDFYHPGWKVYKGDKDYYAVSWNAVFDKYPRAVVVQIHFLYNDQHYHLLVSDDKWYTGSPRGTVDKGETLAEATKREVWEETRIDLSDINLIDIGSYSTQIYNALVNYKAIITNTIFAAFLPFWKVEHLFNFELDNNKINIVEIDDGSLNETELIIAFNDEILDDVPEFFPDFMKNRLGKLVPLDFAKDFVSRQFLERFMDNKLLVLPKKFLNPQLNKHFNDALDEWNQSNLDYQF